MKSKRIQMCRGDAATTGEGDGMGPSETPHRLDADGMSELLGAWGEFAHGCRRLDVDPFAAARYLEGFPDGEGATDPGCPVSGEPLAPVATGSVARLGMSFAASILLFAGDDGRRAPLVVCALADGSSTPVWSVRLVGGDGEDEVAPVEVDQRRVALLASAGLSDRERAVVSVAVLHMGERVAYARQSGMQAVLFLAGADDENRFASRFSELVRAADMFRRW